MWPSQNLGFCRECTQLSPQQLTGQVLTSVPGTPSRSKATLRLSRASLIRAFCNQCRWGLLLLPLAANRVVSPELCELDLQYPDR